MKNMTKAHVREKCLEAKLREFISVRDTRSCGGLGREESWSLLVLRDLGPYSDGTSRESHVVGSQLKFPCFTTSFLTILLLKFIGAC